MQLLPSVQKAMSHPSRDRPGPSTKRMIAIYLIGIPSGLVSLVGIVGTILAITNWVAAPNWPAFGILFGVASITGLAIWLTVHLNSFLAKPGPPKSDRCQCCVAVAPTIKVSLHRHIGLILGLSHKSVGGYLCKACIRRTFWEFTPATFILGWWGLVSVFATPVVLIINSVALYKSSSMPDGGDTAIENVVST